jgi:hypothetical protein
VYASRDSCRCGEPKPENPVDAYETRPEPEVRPGDWNCVACGRNVWARHSTCRCGAAKPE